MNNIESIMIHSEYLSDTKLSLAARGLMATMLYLKKNKIECSFSIKGLAPHVQDTEYQIAKMLKELEKKGYLVRNRICQNGKVLRWETIFNGSKLSDEDKAQSFRNKNSNPINKIKKSFNSKSMKITEKTEPYYENKDMDISADSVISNEPSNKENTNVNPCVEIQDVGVRNNMIDRYNNIIIKKNNNINQSLVNLQVNVNRQPEIQNVETCREDIKKQIGYDFLCEYEDVNEVDCIVGVITDVICTDENTELRVAKRNMNISVLKEHFLNNLKEVHIRYVLENLKTITTKIKNIRAYLITSLYNAIQTLQLHENANLRNRIAVTESECSCDDEPKINIDPKAIVERYYALLKAQQGITANLTETVPVF